MWNLLSTLWVLHSDKRSLRNFPEWVGASAGSCNPAAPSSADPRQMVYGHTLGQRRSTSVDSTAGSVTRGGLTDQYEPAKNNVCVNASARCRILNQRAIFGNPFLLLYISSLFSHCPGCNGRITGAKLLSSCYKCQQMIRNSLSYAKKHQVVVLIVSIAANTEVRSCVIVHSLLLHNRVPVSHPVKRAFAEWCEERAVGGRETIHDKRVMEDVWGGEEEGTKKTWARRGNIFVWVWIIQSLLVQFVLLHH